MKKIVVLFSMFFVLFSIANLKAQTNWIDFGNNGENNQLPDINMISSSNYIANFYGVKNYRKIINDTVYDVLDLPGNFGKTTDIGFPRLPVFTYYIEVTSDTPVISINSANYNIIQNYYLFPAQLSETIGEWDSIPPFTKNDSIYALNQFYPLSNIKVSFPSVCRGHKIATVVVYPVQFNPVTNQIKVIQNIDFTVQNAGSVASDKDNVLFDNFLKSNVINYLPNSTPDYNIDLLIITPDEFVDLLIPFKKLKEKLGIRTSIVTKSMIGNINWFADQIPDDDYEGIDGYINNLYESQGTLAPEFLLLIGESDLLPTHYYFEDDTEGPIASDSYYTTMNLTPFSNQLGILDFADFFGGRISVDNNSELFNIINKIIIYESNPYTGNSDVYNNILLSSLFQSIDNNGNGPCGDLSWDCGFPNFPGRDCRFYIQTSENISDYLMEVNYNLTKVYYSNIDYPTEYKNGDPLPDGIEFYGDWDGPLEQQATDDIIQTINDGVFLINHRDHGISGNFNGTIDGWGSPSFNQSHITDLTNALFNPIMFSINCRTAWFDGATDWPPEGNGVNYDCFGEQLLSKEGGGISGYIGSSRASIMGYNDELNKGLIDAIWEDFDPFLSEIQTPTYYLGSILNHGLLFTYNKFILTQGINYDIGLNSARNRRTFEQFHVLGDPTLEMWTGVPQPLYAYVDYTQNMVTVYDNNGQVIPEAKVVMQHGTDYIVKMTDVNGQIYSSLLNNNYDVEVSALKHNYIPWYSTKITSSQTWDVNENVRGNIIVSNGSTLTFTSDITIPKYARIIVEPGATLKINNGVTVSFENGFNDILAFGNLLIQPNANMVMTLPGSGTERAKIELKNETITYSYKDVDFTKCVVKGIPFKLRLENADFANGSVEIEKADVEILSSQFQNSFVTIKFPRNKSGYANIKLNSTFSGTPTAIFIDGYSNYQISNCAIHNCTDGIKIFNAGGSINYRRIIENEIYNNSGIGITIYRSYTQIVMNNIYNNGYGIHSLDRSNVYIGGNNLATIPSQTQQIKDNLLNEVYATNYGFPYYFKWNAVIDEDNHEPMIYYAGMLGANLDVRDNYWGVNFYPVTDLYPWQSYNYLPVWPLGGGSSSSGPEELYISAQENIDQGEYAAAQSDYQQIVTEYPASLYSQAALRDLWSIEEDVANNYSTLKSYYNTEPNIISTPELTKLADFLANFCDIKLENWPTAIAWFEDVIQQPETFEDSIFAIIDLGYTYWLMENSGLKSSYTGALSQYKIGSQKDYEENRDYLLSLLPGDGLSEAMKQSLSTLKTGELLQNVPNPFNGTTQIWFKLAEESSVSIAICDYTGKEVSVINPGTLKTGNHSVEFNSANLPSGIYFYSLEVNGIKTDTKKMTLIR